MMLARFTPTASMRTSAKTTSEMTIATSPRMRGTARFASSTLTTKVISTRIMPSATSSRHTRAERAPASRRSGTRSKRDSTDKTGEADEQHDHAHRRAAPQLGRSA